MDLLLDLAERQRIDLGRISIQALAEQFTAALEHLATSVPLEHRAEWLVLATRLVLLRSRLLFPKTPAEAQAAARDAETELRRLDTITQIRAATDWLQTRPQLAIDTFTRPNPTPARETGYVALMQACLATLRGPHNQPQDTPTYRPDLPDLWRVADALARIRTLLAAHPKGGPLPAFLPPLPPDDPHRPLKTRAALASTLLASLELARGNTLTLDQPAQFEPLRIAAATGIPL